MLQSQDSAQMIKNAELFNALRKKPKKISEEATCQKVERYLKEGANINAQDKGDQDNTVLHIAVINNYQEIVRFLLQKGAKIRVLNSNGKSPLDLAKDQQN